MKNAHTPMRSIWHSLLWKEWHEHKWKLAALTGICLVALSAYGLDDSTSRSRVVVLFLLIPLSYCILAGIFIGMSTAGRESGRNTLAFLQSLPVPMWRPGIIKLMVAILAASLPLIVYFSTYFLFFWNSGPLLAAFFEAEFSRVVTPGEVSGIFCLRVVGAVLGVSSIVTWVAAAGLNRSDEIRAGAIGFLVISLTWLVFASLVELTGKWGLHKAQSVIKVSLAAAPGSFGFPNTVTWLSPNESWLISVLPYLATALIAHGFLLRWYLRRFGRIIPRPVHTDFNVQAHSSSSRKTLPPMRNQLVAIAWKQCRETGPLALIAAGGVTVFSLIGWYYDPIRRTAKGFGEIMAGVTLSVCFFVTIVAGIGVFLEDLKPRVEDFWRSRPVNYALWFAVKFVVGFLVLVAAFGTLMAVALFLDDSILRLEKQPDLLVASFSMVFLLIYTLSMSTYCILRQPLYAAVLALGLFFGGLLAVSWIDHYFVDGSLHWSIGLVLMLLSQVAATALAWMAVKRDWRLFG